MGGGQAFAVALGLVFLVFAGLYVLARSHREKPDDPQPIWWMALGASATIGIVIFFVYVGTLVLSHGAPNYFLSAGVAVFCYGVAISASGKIFKPSILRARWLAFALMFSLFAVGAAIEGGPVGIGGAILSVLVASFWWSLVVKIPWSKR